jgi:hypothetical protein
MTLGVLPSITATHELVVPKSMPMIRPMSVLLASRPGWGQFVSNVDYVWISCVVFKPCDTTIWALTR